MTVKLHSVVKTRKALPGVLPGGGDLPAGSEGTVVLVHQAPRRAFEVEFCAEDGATLATVALSEDEIEPG